MELFFTILLIIFGIGYLLRLLMPWFMKLLIRRMQKRYGMNTQYTQQQQREGEVTVDDHATRPAKKKKVTKDVGDYVDFEEVE